MGERGVRIGQLPSAGLAAELQPRLIEHAQAAGPDRVTKTLQAAVGIDRQPTAGVELSAPIRLRVRSGNPELLELATRAPVALIVDSAVR